MDVGRWETEPENDRHRFAPAPLCAHAAQNLITDSYQHATLYKDHLLKQGQGDSGQLHQQQQTATNSRRSSTSQEEPLDFPSAGSFASWARPGLWSQNSPQRPSGPPYSTQTDPGNDSSPHRNSISNFARVRAATAAAAMAAVGEQPYAPANEPYETSAYQDYGHSSYDGGAGGVGGPYQDFGYGSQYPSHGVGARTQACGNGPSGAYAAAAGPESYPSGDYGESYAEDSGPNVDGGEVGGEDAAEVDASTFPPAVTHARVDEDAEGGGGTAATGSGNSDPFASYAWPSDPEAMLSLLQQQRQQYRSWVAQCAATALAALDPLYGNSTTTASGSTAATAGGMPEDVPGMLAAMDSAASVREYLVQLKVAAEAVSEASRALSAFQALSLPEGVSGASDDPAVAAAGEAAEAEYVSAAYAVTTAVAAAAGQLTQLKEQAAAAGVVQELLSSGSAPAGGLEAPLQQKLDRVGGELCQRLREEASVLMTLIGWSPPLADSSSEVTPSSEAAAGEGPPAAAAAGSAGAFAGFEAHPITARRLVGLLTALTHFQMAVDQRPVFYQLLAGPQEGLEAGDAAGPVKPLLWAAKVLAEPVAAKLRAHFHPAAPTGRLDRPAWLYGTVLDFVRCHGHSLSSLDDMLACLQLKPHYNMPAEFARALQEAVLQQLRDQRIPAIVQLRNRHRRPQPDSSAAAYENGGSSAVVAAAGDAEDDDADDTNNVASAAAAAAETDALWLGLMDASAAYDIALLPLLGATGPRVEADAARAASLLAAAATAGSGSTYSRRVCDLLDPNASGTADMHLHYVAVAALTEAVSRTGLWTAQQLQGATPVAEPAGAAAGAAPLLAAWAAAEGAAALRTVEAVLYDESSLESAEQATARALGGLPDLDDTSAAASNGLTKGGGRGAAARGGAASGGVGGGAGGGGAPWQQDTWPPAMAREVAEVLDGLAARSRWLSANPAAQRDFLQTAAGPVLAAVRRRLGRLVDQAVARGDVLSEEGLPRVCAALCSSHFLDEHLHSLLITELAPLVHALNVAAATTAAAAGDDAAAEPSGPGTPTSSVVGGGSAVPAGKLGGGSGGFWSGLLAAAAGGGGSSAAVPSSPARLALRDGVTALAGGAGSVTSAAGGGGGGGVTAPVLGVYVRAFSRFHRDGCLKVAREVALGFGRHSVLYRQAIEASRQFPFTPEEDEANGQPPAAAHGSSSRLADGSSEPATSITPAFAPALLFLQTTLERLSRCCDKVTFADVWRGAALSINRFMFNFIATESRFTRAGARQFAADVTGLAHLFVPYSMRRGASAGLSREGSSSSAAAAANAAGGQHFRELQAAARLLCLGDEEAADVMRRASAAAVAAQAAAAAGGTPGKVRHGAMAPTSTGRHARGDPVRASMSSDAVLSSGGLACLSPLQIMNVIEHRI